MPKSSKRRKEKAADFSKAKLKLGKGKQTPSNAVDTSFKARSITLPSQTIAIERSSHAPTTKRKLTFEDLMSHLKHYNAGTRKDAILGLRELLEDHPDLVVPSLTTLFNGCIRVITDEDASVRKTLLAFFGWLLPRVPQDDLVPHAQLLLLFATSAQTHIFPEIRVDAVRFLDIFMEATPEVVVEGWAQGSAGHGRRVLEGYLGILSAGTAFNETGDHNAVHATSTASIILSSASKLVVLTSLLSFLSHALSLTSTLRRAANPHQPVVQERTPTWYMSAAFASTSAFETFDFLLLSADDHSKSAQVTEWQETISDGDCDHVVDGGFALERIGESWSLADFSDFMSSSSGTRTVGQSGTDVRPESAYVAHLIRALQPILTATFLDSAPAVFSPSGTPPETDLQTICTVAGITRCLYGALSSRSAQLTQAGLVNSLSAFVGHMTPYFPFSVYLPITARRDIKVEQALQGLNLTFCELTSFLLLDASPEEQVTGRQKKHQLSSQRTLPVQLEYVCDYVIKTLRGDSPGDSLFAASLSRPVSAASYCSILPTVWALLNNASPTHVDAVLCAVLEHATTASSASAVKRHTIDFVGRLLMLETQPEYRGRFRLRQLHQNRGSIEEWLMHLPKALWELGARDLLTTETILRFLLRLSQRDSSFFQKSTSISLSARFLPYFVIHHNTRGKLTGPFSKLPVASHVRALVLDVAFSLCATGTSDGFIDAVREAASGGGGDYWTSICNSLRVT